MRKRFFSWLFNAVQRHRHGPKATWRDRVQCDLYDWAAGMPARLIAQERWRKIRTRR